MAKIQLQVQCQRGGRMLCRGAGGRTQPLTCGAVMLGTMEHNMTASRRAQRMRNASVAGVARPVDAANESSRREPRDESTRTAGAML